MPINIVRRRLPFSQRLRMPPQLRYSFTSLPLFLPNLEDALIILINNNNANKYAFYMTNIGYCCF